MPELPEVEFARRQAEKALLGRRIVRVAVDDDRIVFDGIPPARFASALTDRTVLAIGRRGKHLWIELDRRPWPTFHFGMTGYFETYRDPADRPRFWKAELLTDDGLFLTMVNKRRLGRIRLRHDPPAEPPISRLGFDPLADRLSPSRFAAMLTRRNATIKAVLLDQSFIAGVGNWIADEVLYQARIAPARIASGLTPQEVSRIFSKLRSIIRKAVELDADNERFPRTWLFHHRWGKNAEARTHRGEKIIHQTIGGRTTAWVPARQK
ncbi:MAG: hypothetical protein GXY33_09035 [Phycisphaerae bacterium]|nr:hypothetical protein [Phycisphaerae bacterium]